jgi:flagellar hook-length control protein FliK
LANRANPEAAPDVAEGDIKQTELSPNRSEGVRMPTETGTPGTDHMHVSEHPTATLSPTEAAPTNSLATDNLTDIMDQLSGQISYWAAQGTQRASLTVSNDKDNPLEVNISMRDGEVNVAFEATQDDVREALTTHAEALLKDMLESKGMTLGDVTVGQRPPTPDQGEATPHNRNGQNTATTVGTAPGILARSTQNGQSNLNPIPHRPDIATAQKVDLFA